MLLRHRKTDWFDTQSTVSRAVAAQSHTIWSVIDRAVKLTVCSRGLTWLLLVWHVISRCCAQSCQCPWPSVCVCVCVCVHVTCLTNNHLNEWTIQLYYLSQQSTGSCVHSHFATWQTAHKPLFVGHPSTDITGRRADENMPARSRLHTNTSQM